MKFETPEGATPLTLDELHELIPPFITTQAELNGIEQMHIAKALSWLNRENLSYSQILDESFIRNLHIQMYGKIWKWAGKYRKSDKNIGVEWIKIPILLRQLLEDTRYQIEHQSYSLQEIAGRFHHKLVWIHLFPNGNGRHARVLSDYLLKQLGENTFTWGGKTFQEYRSSCEIRKQYISALRQADQGNYEPLLTFVKS